MDGLYDINLNTGSGQNSVFKRNNLRAVLKYVGRNCNKKYYHKIVIRKSLKLQIHCI